MVGQIRGLRLWSFDLHVETLSEFIPVGLEKTSLYYCLEFKKMHTNLVVFWIILAKDRDWSVAKMSHMLGGETPQLSHKDWTKYC